MIFQALQKKVYRLKGIVTYVLETKGFKLLGCSNNSDKEIFLPL
jgi:hypothetical protein